MQLAKEKTIFCFEEIKTKFLHYKNADVLVCIVDVNILFQDEKKNTKKIMHNDN